MPGAERLVSPKSMHAQDLADHATERGLVIYDEDRRRIHLWLLFLEI
jgi:hypothetical protein